MFQIQLVTVSCTDSMFSKSALTFVAMVSSMAKSSASTICQPTVTVNSELYQYGQEIQVDFAQCGEETTHPEDFLAVYRSTADLEDIKGDANYRMWMWSCGTQFCHASANSNTVVFGPETNKHTWPLAPGDYQVHLVKPNDDGTFSSSSASQVFTVEEDDFLDAFSFDRDLEETCEDEVTMAKPCVEEGDAVSVILRNECQEFEEGDWFGFYYEDECDEDYCEGEPLIWSWVCKGDDCNRPLIQYKFRHHSDILLPVGRYRVAFVGADDEEIGEEDVIYEPTLLSRVFEVHPRGESCTLVWRNSM